MKPRSIRPHLVALAALGIATTATGAETPYDVVLAIPYGFERGMLDTSRVDREDPFQTLVAAYQVADEMVYLRLRQWILMDSLLCYRNGTLVGTLPMKGASDFLVLPDGTIFGVTFGYGTDDYARLYRRAPDGTTEMVRLQRETLDSHSYLERFQLLGGQVFLTNPHEIRHTVELESSHLPSKLTLTDIEEGIPTDVGRTWQNMLYIMRGTEPVLDLGSGGGDLVWVFEDGGFVIGRGTESDTSGEAYHVYDYYDAAATLAKRIATRVAPQRFGADRPVVFTEDHLYMLVFSEERAELLRYGCGR